MNNEISKYYGVDENGNLVYISTYNGGKITKTNKVWGISNYGFCHGVGAYLQRRGNEKLINKPTFAEIEEYLKKIDNFNRLLGNE